jgi:hypothetical protein
MLTTIIIAVCGALGISVVSCGAIITKHIIKLTPIIKDIAPELKKLITESRTLITAKTGITSTQMDSAVEAVKIEATKDIPVVETAVVAEVSADTASKIKQIEAILDTLPIETVAPVVTPVG